MGLVLSYMVHAESVQDRKGEKWALAQPAEDSFRKPLRPFRRMKAFALECGRDL
ncbi:MAG: hypothetical protein KDA86_27480 [Planctomycetaceae bacterium]|nr:hypothetical protein [Planctomycetaceae bacterium]